MTEAADLILLQADGHTLTEPDERFEALAIRDGGVVRVGRNREVAFLEGIETEVIDCDGRTVIPGFVDAHTHMETLGRYQVHADCSDVDSRAACLDRLHRRGEAIERQRRGDDVNANTVSTDEDGPSTGSIDSDWILGFGYDESDWSDDRYLTRNELDQVSQEHPVAALRVDMHTASVNGVALERLGESLPESDVETENGDPTGVIVEDATEVLWEAIDPGPAQTRATLEAAIEYANAQGVTMVHDMVRNSHAPRVYRDLEAEDELDIRVRLNYWSDHLESVVETGLRTNSGSGFVQVGAIKSFTDGSIGARTAKLSSAYHDATSSKGDDQTDRAGDANDRDGRSEDHNRGQWVVDPETLRELVECVEDQGLQLSIHAIGDEAIDEVVSALEDADGEPEETGGTGDETVDQGGSRHRIEHVELATDDQIERMAAAGIVASMQPNFHRWADEGGLYDRRLGADRRVRTNRLATMRAAGVPLAFGSDCMPLDPLFGVDHAVTAPTDAQALSVTQALRAYTLGGAYAGFDENRLGTIEVGKRADLVVLQDSPWEQDSMISEIDVAITMVDGDVVYDSR